MKTFSITVTSTVLVPSPQHNGPPAHVSSAQRPTCTRVLSTTAHLRTCPQHNGPPAHVSSAQRPTCACVLSTTAHLCTCPQPNGPPAHVSSAQRPTCAGVLSLHLTTSNHDAENFPCCYSGSTSERNNFIKKYLEITTKTFQTY